MIDRNVMKPSILRQCQMLNISRSSVHYRPRLIKPEDLEIMRLIGERYLNTSCGGSRSMSNFIDRRGCKINRKRVQRLMRLRGLEAIYPKPKTSRPHPKHKVCPYFLKNMTIDRTNPVWAADITTISMNRGHMYLVAVMDWHSRKDLSWSGSNNEKSPENRSEPLRYFTNFKRDSF